MSEEPTTEPEPTPTTEPEPIPEPTPAPEAEPIPVKEDNSGEETKSLHLESHISYEEGINWLKTVCKEGLPEDILEIIAAKLEVVKPVTPPK